MSLPLQRVLETILVVSYSLACFGFAPLRVQGVPLPLLFVGNGECCEPEHFAWIGQAHVLKVTNFLKLKAMKLGASSKLALQVSYIWLCTAPSSLHKGALATKKRIQNHPYCNPRVLLMRPENLLWDPLLQVTT